MAPAAEPRATSGVHSKHDWHAIDLRRAQPPTASTDEAGALARGYGRVPFTGGAIAASTHVVPEAMGAEVMLKLTLEGGRQQIVRP
jgi:hypothetical protein